MAWTRGAASRTTARWGVPSSASRARATPGSCCRRGWHSIQGGDELRGRTSSHRSRTTAPPCAGSSRTCTAPGRRSRRHSTSTSAPETIGVRAHAPCSRRSPTPAITRTAPGAPSTATRPSTRARISRGPAPRVASGASSAHGWGWPSRPPWRGSAATSRPGASADTRSPVMLVQLFGVVTALSGAAALSLDVERAASIASMIEIFAVVPQRVAAAGIYAFCEGLKEIGREYQARVCPSRSGCSATGSTIPSSTVSCPTTSARVLYVSGALAARGAFAHDARRCEDRPRMRRRARRLRPAALHDGRESAAVSLLREPRGARQGGRAPRAGRAPRRPRRFGVAGGVVGAAEPHPALLYAWAPSTP